MTALSRAAGSVAEDPAGPAGLQRAGHPQQYIAGRHEHQHFTTSAVGGLGVSGLPSTDIYPPLHSYTT